MPSFNRIDICEAYWVFATLYHGGQYSTIYRIFGRLDRLGFNPRRSLCSDNLTDNGSVIYHGLVNKFIDRCKRKAG